MSFPTPTQSIAPVAVGPVIRTQHIGAELAIDLGLTVLVASCSQPDSWHEVRDGRCTCKGFQYRNTCRHLGIAVQAQMAGVETAAPIISTGAAALALCSLDDDRDYYSSAAIRGRQEARS